MPRSVSPTILTSLRVSRPRLLLRGRGMRLQNLPMAFFCPLYLPSLPTLTLGVGWPSWGNPDLEPQWPIGWFSAKANWLFSGFSFWTWLLCPNLLPASCMTPILQAYYWPPRYAHGAPCCAELVQQHPEALSQNSHNQH